MFVPNNNSINRLHVEKAQFAGIRSALGYRNSTPTNVILAEAKLTMIKKRAKLLAKNLCIKILAFGEEKLKKDIIESCDREAKHMRLFPWRNYTVLTDSWLKCTRYEKIIGASVKYPVFNLGFWDATREIYRR